MGVDRIDYRDLLKRYMQHVADCEGTTYLDHIDDPERVRAALARGTTLQYSVVIESHEMEELKRLDEEVNEHIARL